MSEDRHLPESVDPAEIVALDQLTAEERAEAEKVAAGLDVRDTLAVTSFAVQLQKDLANVTDPILKMVATKDVGPAGASLSNLQEQVRLLDAGSLAGQTENALAHMPGVGPLFSKARQFVGRYETVARKIDHILVNLEGARNTMLADIATLDQLYDRNLEFYRALLVYIAAGEIKLHELQALHDDLAAQANATHDMVTAQRAADLRDLQGRLERRVYDLKLTAVIALQSGPQIRLVQNGDQSLVEKVQSSILLTIPLWKRQIIIAISLFDQKRALELQRAVTDTTNQLLQQNAQLLRQGTAQVAREAERGIADIETLTKVNDDLIATIQEALAIQQEGREKRRAAEKQLEAIRKRLKDTLGQARERERISVNMPRVHGES